MKERVTLTLDTNLLEKIDKKVDGFKIKNRSHAIELMCMKALGLLLELIYTLKQNK